MDILVLFNLVVLEVFLEVVEFSEDVWIGCGAASGEHVVSALLEDHVLEVGVSHHFNASHAFSSQQVRVATFLKH